MRASGGAAGLSRCAAVCAHRRRAESSGPFGTGRASAWQAWLDERLFAASGAQAGDKVGLGKLELVASAMISFRVGSRREFLQPAGDNDQRRGPRGHRTDQEGSRISYHLQLAGDEPALARVPAGGAEPRLGRGPIHRIGSTMRVRPQRASIRRSASCVALLAVILAAVAVGLSARRFMQRHVDSCAVMRCLGAPSRQVTTDPAQISPSA